MIENKKRNILKKWAFQIRMLFKDLPTISTCFFVLSVVLMNFLANKEIYWGNDWFALDCGITVSWFTFLYMDIITRLFDAKATIIMGIFALIVNLIVSLAFIGVSYIPGNWAQFYKFDDNIVNEALNNTINSSWYILFGSTVAFLTSCTINAVLNQLIGGLFKKKHFIEYITRSYISTIIAQFIDNLIFTLIVSYNFFGWNIKQCISCALTGAIVEFLLEAIFSPFGYMIAEKWRKNNLSRHYKAALKKEYE